MRTPFIETAYDALQRPVLTTREGHGSQPDLFTETAYDAAGRVTFRRTSSGGLSQVTTNAYDLAGRRIPRLPLRRLERHRRNHQQPTINNQLLRLGFGFERLHPGCGRHRRPSRHIA